MGLTLIEAAKYENRLEHLAVLKTFSEGELLSRLPFMNIAGSGIFYAQEAELPTVGFRAVNEGYTQSYGVAEQRAEAVHLFGGDVDVDRSIVDLMGPEARASQIEMKIRSMRLTLEATIVKGDSASNPRGFNGLQKRLPRTGGNAVNNGGRTVNLDALDALVDSVDGMGRPKYLLMSKAVRRQLNALARAGGCCAYSAETNSLGAVVHRYQECEILTVDRDAQGREILGFSEAGDTTSIYCLAFGDQGVTGLQGPFQGRYGISVRDLGEVPDAPVFRTRVDWYVGFAVLHERSAGRLFNITAA